MAKGLDIKIGVDGMTETFAALKDVRRSVKNKVLRAAMTFALKPFLPAAKRAAPTRFGVLKKALIQKIKVYTKGESGVAVGLIGPETKFKATVTVTNPITGQTSSRIAKPSKYVHLVETGARPHTIMPPGFAKSKDAKVKGWQHPGTKPQPFLHPTAVAQSAGFISRFRQKFAERLAAEYTKARAKGKRFYDFEEGR